MIDLVVYNTPTMLLKRFLKQDHMVLLTEDLHSLMDYIVALGP